MRLRTAALALACGLCIAGIAWGEDDSSGNWLTRMFSRNDAKAPKDIDVRQVRTVMPAPTNADRLKKAAAALSRRQEVCLALQKIAEDRNDDALRRKAEQLDRQAWELYEAATRSIRPGSMTQAVDAGKNKEGRR